ncbi:YagK/YfjJ domain-containing protein, partial [Escherichia coli]
VITRFIASLKAQIAAYLQRRRRDGKRVYPCKLRYAWVREFGELNGNKHYHMLLLVNREVFRNTMLNTENSAQPRGL